MKYVLDASVILTFLLGNNPTVNHRFPVLLQKASHNALKLYSTSFLPFEIGNGLRYTLNDPPLAQLIFDRFTQLPITLINLSFAQQMTTLHLCYQLKTSFYDTSYHVLAQTLQATFITCDKKYYQKAKNLKSIRLW